MRIDNEYIKNHPAEKPPTGEFATTSYDDYDELRNALIDIIPEFTMKLKVEFNDGYALADSRYFSYYDGDMLLLPGYDGECVIKAILQKKKKQKENKRDSGRTSECSEIIRKVIDCESGR